MDDQTKMALAAAAAGGYLLGRTKKARFALTTVAFVMGRSLEPRQLLIQGMRILRDVPQVSELGEQVKGELFEAGRSAVMAAAQRRLGSLTGTPDEPPASDEAGKDQAAEEPSEEGGPDDEPDTGRPAGRAEAGRRERAEGESRQRATPRKPGASRTDKKAPGKSAPGRSAAAGKTPAKKSAPAGRTSPGKPSGRSDRGR